MTLHVPLVVKDEQDSMSGLSSTPSKHARSKLRQPKDHALQLERAARTIAKARRVVVVCGAGISVQAGIPDFRSSTGLFQQLKEENPKALSSGRELFDAQHVFHSESTASVFYKMVARLAIMADEAHPTPFHRLLKGLDDRGQLLRCYTQNIDGIEERAGLSFGLPPPRVRMSPKKRRSKKDDEDAGATSSERASVPVQGENDETKPESATSSKPPSTSSKSASKPAFTSSSRTPPLVDMTPRCIPLHGTLKTLHCASCGNTSPLREHVSRFSTGTAPSCSQCSELDHTRHLVGKRLRGVGVMRPSIVLYNEDHREGEKVGDVVKMDLTGGRQRRAPPDLLIVAGTSLKVPGTKRIVKEFAKAAQCRSERRGVKKSSDSDEEEEEETPSSSLSSSEEESEDEEERPIRTIYLNLDFPQPTREWETTFDMWIQGDVQTFAGMAHAAMESEDGARRERAATRMRVKSTRGAKGLNDSPEMSGVGTRTRKRKREMEAAEAVEAGRHMHADGSGSGVAIKPEGRKGLERQDSLGLEKPTASMTLATVTTARNTSRPDDRHLSIPLDCSLSMSHSPTESRSTMASSSLHSILAQGVGHSSSINGNLTMKKRRVDESSFVVGVAEAYNRLHTSSNVSTSSFSSLRHVSTGRPSNGTSSVHLSSRTTLADAWVQRAPMMVDGRKTGHGHGHDRDDWRGATGYVDDWRPSHGPTSTSSAVVPLPRLPPISSLFAVASPQKYGRSSFTMY